MQRFWTVVGGVVFGASTAWAAGCDSLFPNVGAFSIVAKENLTQERTDTEGRIAVGGDGKFANCSIGTKAAGSGFTYPYTILVGNDFKFTDGSVWNGAVGVGGAYSTSAASFSNGVGRVNAKPLLDVFQVEIGAAGTVVGVHPSNGKIAVKNERLELTATAGDLAVFEVTAQQLGAARELFVDVPEGATVLVRVRGASVAMNRLSFYYRGAVAERTLFHLPDATLVELDRVSVEGSLLAPGAAVAFRNGEMNGNLYAKSLAGNGRVNQVRFAGCLRP